MPPPVQRPCAAQAEPEELAGTIRITVENVTTALEGAGVMSERATIAGFPWQIMARKEMHADGVEYLSLYTSCHKGEEAAVWHCDCTVDYTIVNQQDEGASVTTMHSHRFGSVIGSCFGPAQFIRWDAVMDIEEEGSITINQGFVKRDRIILEARIVVDSCVGKTFRKKECYDFSSPSEKSDVVLVVEEKEFHVSKQLLAVHSSYFENLFFTEFNEKGKKTIELKEISATEFATLLRILYRQGQAMDDTNVEYLLKLAEMWDIGSVLNEAETYLIYSRSTRLALRLQLADNYRLPTLMYYCLAQLTKCTMIADLKQTVEYERCTGETKERLFHLYTELCGCDKPTSQMGPYMSYMNDQNLSDSSHQLQIAALQQLGALLQQRAAGN